jgi:hypothetical protein
MRAVAEIAARCAGPALLQIVGIGLRGPGGLSAHPGIQIVGRGGQVAFVLGRACQCTTHPRSRFGPRCRAGLGLGEALVERLQRPGRRSVRHAERWGFLFLRVAME